MDEYGKKGVPASEMFKVIRSIRTIEQGIADLFDHKARFVFSGDQSVINKTFREMKMDYKTEADRAKSLRKKQQGYNNTLTGLNYKKDVEDFNKISDEKLPNQAKIDELAERLKDFHEN